MLDDRTKALVKAIGLKLDQPGDFEQPQQNPVPVPEPDPVDGHEFASGDGQSSARSRTDGVTDLEQSYVAAVITAQQLANQMLEMTNRWVAVLEERDEGQRIRTRDQNSNPEL